MIRAWMEEPRVRFLSLPQRERRDVKSGFEVEGNGYREGGGFEMKGRSRESTHEERLVLNFHLGFIHEMKR